MKRMILVLVAEVALVVMVVVLAARGAFDPRPDQRAGAACARRSPPWSTADCYARPR